MRNSEKVDKTDLNNAIKAANDAVGKVTVGVVKGNYAQSDVDTYKVAIAAAKTIADKVDADKNAVDKAVKDLATAKTTFEKTVIKEDLKAVVDKTDLNNAIKAANDAVGKVTVGVVKGNYAQSDVDTYKAAIAAAKAIADKADADKNAVNKAVKDLATAKTTFEKTVIKEDPKAVVDKTDLNNAIKAANDAVGKVIVGVAKGNYAQSDVDTYKAAIAAAKTIADKADADKNAVDKAVKDLATAKTTFEGKVAK